MNWKILSINWVDGAILILFFIGMKRGQRRGMSQELIDFFKWLTIVLVAGFTVKPLGEYLARTAHFGILMSNIIVYSTAIVFFLLVGAGLNTRFNDHLASSDMFGNAEYYLGTLAGGIRFLCIIFVAFSFVNARHLTPTDLQTSEAYQLKYYGSSFFPTLGSIQKECFGESSIGRFTTNYLRVVMITPTLTSQRASAASARTGVGVKARERMLDEYLEKH